MSYYIGIDIGTSSVKAMLINENEIQNTISKDYPIYLSNGNYAEQNPEDWYRQSMLAMKELLRDVDKSEVKAIGFCGQMHGLVLLDEKDEVIRPAILWNDGRSEKEVDYLNNKIGKDFLLDNTGNIAFAGFTAPKLLWVYNHEPDNFKRISKILLPKDYVAFMLSGVFATDVSDAAGTLYFDTEHRCWSKPMLQLLHIDESFLPAVYESSQSVGCIKEKLADELELCPDTKIIIGAGDNAASAIGTGTVNDGDCNISLGTSGTIFACTEKYNCDRKNAIHSFCSANGKYHYLACTLTAASSQKWWIEDILKSSYDYEKDAEMLKPSERNIKSHEEAIQQMKDFISERGAWMDENIEIIKSQGVNISKAKICGGGTKNRLWLKLIATILNVQLEIPSFEDAGALGACLLAAKGNGNNVSDNFYSIKETIIPDKTFTQFYENKYNEYLKLYRMTNSISQTRR